MTCLTGIILCYWLTRLHLNQASSATYFTYCWNQLKLSFLQIKFISTTLIFIWIFSYDQVKHTFWQSTQLGPDYVSFWNVTKSIFSTLAFQKIFAQIRRSDKIFLHSFLRRSPPNFWSFTNRVYLRWQSSNHFVCEKPSLALDELVTKSKKSGKKPCTYDP